MNEYYILQDHDNFMFVSPHGACWITSVDAAAYVAAGMLLIHR